MRLRHRERDVAALQVDAALDAVDVAGAVGGLPARLPRNQRCMAPGSPGSWAKTRERVTAHAAPSVGAARLRRSFSGVAGDVLEVHAGGGVVHHDADVVGAEAAYGAQDEQAEDGEDEEAGVAAIALTSFGSKRWR